MTPEQSTALRFYSRFTPAWVYDHVAFFAQMTTFVTAWQSLVRKKRIILISRKQNDSNIVQLFTCKCCVLLICTTWQWWSKISGILWPITGPDKCLGTVAKANIFGLLFVTFIHAILSTIKQPDKCPVQSHRRDKIVVLLCLAQFSP